MLNIWLSHGTHDDLAGARLTITLKQKRSDFFQYYLVDFEWVVNTPIFAYTSDKKLVKYNARVIILFIMAKDYEHKSNLSELFTISLKILEILHYKSHEAPEWKLCEVF